MYLFTNSFKSKGITRSGYLGIIPKQNAKVFLPRVDPASSNNLKHEGRKLSRSGIEKK